MALCFSARRCLHESYPVRCDFVPVGFSQTDEVHLISADGTKTHNSAAQTSWKRCSDYPGMLAGFSLTVLLFSLGANLKCCRCRSNIRTIYVIPQTLQENMQVLWVAAFPGNVKAWGDPSVTPGVEDSQHVVVIRASPKLGGLNCTRQSDFLLQYTRWQPNQSRWS